MKSVVNWGAAGIRGMLACTAALGMLTGCVSLTPYVDNGLHDVPASEMVKPAQTKPVQLMFEFQTKGAPNGKATDAFNPQVASQVKASGLFAEVEGKPVEGGAVLNVVINNIALNDDAASKGFQTGLTLGLKGNTVGDGYVCTMTYVPDAQGKQIVVTEKHAIYSTIGMAEPPANATKAANLNEAVNTMMRQILDNALLDLSKAPDFAK